MKNLTKIFMAVAVALFAFSCVNDATEDAAVKVGGKTTLAISLGGGNRTALGEAVDGVYPITWAEGDQITVNGETSNELTAVDGAGTANAVFTFNDELAAPYCVAYPAAEAGQVVFAAEQEYVDGTFANGAATMYGYSNGGSVKLNHLTGVLKIGVVCGEDVDLFDAPIIQSVKISTIDRAPIAGAFNIDFATGAVTATDDAVSVINYTLDEKLSQNPTYLHVAVPAGVYNELYVTLEDKDGGVMYATVKADDDKPLVAGKVRTFSSDIVYAATNAVVIKDAASLKAWAKSASTSSDKVVMAADVDMSNEDWTSVAGFSGEFLGNGFAIKGLKAPLFATTTASAIKGVHLTDLEITLSGGKAAYGALAEKVDNKNAVVSHCSVEGNINISKITVNSYIAGLIGEATSTKTFSHLVNKADINVTGTSVSKKIYYAGCVCKLNSGTIESSTNLGNLTTTHSSNATTFLAGVVMYCNKAYNCVNGKQGSDDFGKLTFNGKTGALAFGGVIGDISGTTAETENCVNYGNLYAKGTASSVMIGGFMRDITSSTLNVKNCANYGEIKLEGLASSGVILVGGLSYCVNGTANLTNFVNGGAITMDKDCSSKTTANIGGVLPSAYIAGSNKRTPVVNFDGCSNTGDITVNGSGENCNVGGIYGSTSFSASQSTSTTTAMKFTKGVSNSGDISVEGTFSGAIKVGGIFGDLAENKTTNITVDGNSVSNSGDITCNAEAGTSIYVGGITTYMASSKVNTTFKNCKFINNGAVKAGENANNKAGNFQMGGIFANYQATVSAESTNYQFVNTGDVTYKGSQVSGADEDALYVGGIFGTTTLNVSSLTNTGNVSATGTYSNSDYSMVGGVVGKTTSAIDNAKCYCTVNASYANVGMVTGAASCNVTNSAVGGKIVLDQEYELTADNYAKYLFSNRNLTSYAGVTLLTSAPAAN